jgi:hypothetical protein
MNPCKCGEKLTLFEFEGQYGFECANPKCLYWHYQNYPSMANSESEAVRLWNEWVES